MIGFHEIVNGHFRSTCYLRRMDEDDLPIPTCLNRKLWTTEQWAAADKAREKLIQAHRRAQQAAERRLKQEAEDRKREKEAKERAKADRAALQQARATKRKMRNAALAFVLSHALEKGKLTVISVRKAMPEELKQLAAWAVGSAFKQGKLKREGRKVYRP